MNAAIVRIFALALFIPLQCWATVDISPSWESVEFTAGVFRVQAKTTPPSYRLAKLRIWVSGKRAHIASSEYQGITYPELEKITVTYVTRLRNSNYNGPLEAFIEIPFLVEDPKSDGRLNEGGTLFLYFEGGTFTHSELEPPQEQ